ncbi:MAG: DUF4932 domain-containing protein [Elusimicrobiota bacterium]
MLKLALILALCAATARAQTASYPEIRTDPRVELLAMVQLLARADQRFAGFFRHDIPYDKAAEEHFAPFAGHPVVDFYAELSRRGVSYLTFYDAVLHLGPPPELAGPVSDGVAFQMGGASQAEEFRAMLSDFARVSSFTYFYGQTENLRRPMVDDVRRQAAAIDIVPALEEYLGAPVTTRYTVIISPFAEPVLADALPSVDPDGVPRLTSVYGPEVYKGKFGYRLGTRVGGIWTELTRVYLNDAAKPYAARIEELNRLYEPISRTCETSWYACVQRQVAFAVGARLLERNGGSTGREMARRWPEKYRNFGMPYLRPLVDRLKEYEARKNRGALADFYPRLLEALDESAPKTPAPPFHGGVAAVLDSKGPAVFIMPASPSPELRTAVDALQTRHFPDARRLNDIEALSADLAGKTLVAVGTLNDNAWLAKNYARLKLPTHLAKGRIVFDARRGDAKDVEFSGKLGLVTTALNPFDATRGLLIFTAVDQDAVVSAFAYDGPDDYVVLDGAAILRSGIYEKSWLPWRLK